MNRLIIPRERLIKILLADTPWNPAMLEPALQEGDPELWQRLREAIAEVQADRLLDPSWTGYLLDRAIVREKMVEVGTPLVGVGELQIAGMSLQMTPSIATSLADLQLAMSPIDLSETHKDRWQRVEAILLASQTLGVDATRFLEEYSGAQEYILRLSSSPETFRAHQIERIDDKHPEILARRMQSLRDVLRQEARNQLGVPQLEISLTVPFPTDEGYWQMRFCWLQAVEAQIQRVWGSQIDDA